MSLRIVRLGSPRHEEEGLRIGTVRRPPRGVRKEDFATRNFYDVWYPVLSPSEALLKEFLGSDDDASWKKFSRRFIAEMKKPDAAHTLDLLAALSHEADFSIGCYCENESRCHRSLLRTLFAERGAKMA